MLYAQSGSIQSGSMIAKAIKASITVVRKRGDGKVIDLSRPVTIFGSHKGVRVRLKHPTIAPAHCAIINTGDRLLIRDLESRSGTTLNDEHIRLAELKPGDVIRIDAWKFRVDIKSAGETCSGSSIAATQFCQATSIDLESSTKQARWKDLPEVFVIGRRDSCEVTLDGHAVSRAHALVCVLGGRVAIVDLKSANGIRVNGHVVETECLSPGDRLSIGTHELAVKGLRMPSGRFDSQESCYMFNDAADGRIRLAGAPGDGSSADFMRFAGAPSPAAGAERIGPILPVDRRHEVPSGDTPSVSDERPAVSTGRGGESDAPARKLVERAAELDRHQQALDARELELGDREHLLRESARKLVDDHRATAERAARDAQGDVAGQAEELEARRLEIAELNAKVSSLGLELDELREQSKAAASEAATRVAEVASVEQECERRLSTMSEQEAELARRSLAVSDLAEAVARDRGECDGRIAELEARHGGLVALADDLEARGCAIARREADLAAREHALGTRQSWLDTLATELDARDEALTRRDHALALECKTLEQQADALDRRGVELSRQTDALREDRDALVRDGKAAAGWQEHLETLDAQIATRGAELDKQADQFATDERTLAERCDVVSRREEEVRACRDSLVVQQKRVRKRLTDLKKRRARVCAEFGALELRVREAGRSAMRRSKQFDALRRDLDARNGMLERRATQLDRREVDLKRLEEEATRQIAAFEDCRRAVSARASLMEHRAARLANYRATLNRRRSDLEDSRRCLADEHNDLARQRRELRAHEARLRDGTHQDEGSESSEALAAREAVVAELAKSLEARSLGLNTLEGKLNAREPVLAELSRTLEARAADLESKCEQLAELRVHLDEMDRVLSERERTLEQRETSIGTQQDLLQQVSDPLSVTDERSYEVLRLLNPDLGDSVRVLRRLGVEGSFDELVRRARSELEAAEQRRTSRRWNPFR